MSKIVQKTKKEPQQILILKKTKNTTNKNSLICVGFMKSHAHACYSNSKKGKKKTSLRFMCMT